MVVRRGEKYCGIHWGPHFGLRAGGPAAWQAPPGQYDLRFEFELKRRGRVVVAVVVGVVRFERERVMCCWRDGAREVEMMVVEWWLRCVLR